MSVYARRYFWADASPADNTALLDAFVARPEFLSYPATSEQARAIGAAMLTNPEHLIWGAHDSGKMTGVIILTRVYPKVDALLHFLFIDQNLAGKRKLLHNLLTHLFTDLGFHRLSMEVPEGVRLERFARKVLSFRLEGEVRPRNPELPACLSDNWTARQGSRRDQGYFDGTSWSDIMLLRLLASEWEVECRSPQSLAPPRPSQDLSLARPSEAGDPVTPSPSSPKTSSPSAPRT